MQTFSEYSESLFIYKEEYHAKPLIPAALIHLDLLSIFSPALLAMDENILNYAPDNHPQLYPLQWGKKPEDIHLRHCPTSSK